MAAAKRIGAAGYLNTVFVPSDDGPWGALDFFTIDDEVERREPAGSKAEAADANLAALVVQIKEQDRFVGPVSDLHHLEVCFAAVPGA